jgi:hypothetical protein
VTLRDCKSSEGILPNAKPPQRVPQSRSSKDLVQYSPSSICSRRLPVEYHGYRGRADFHKGTRRRHVIWCTTNADTRTELGLLCTHTRKSPRKRSSAAAASLQSWAGHKWLSLVAHGPRQSSRFLLLFVECMGSGAVSTVFDIHFASHQTRKAHSDAPPSVLPTLAIRRIEHPRGPDECAPGKHPHRCVPHQLRFLPQHCPTKQAEVV